VNDISFSVRYVTLYQTSETSLHCNNFITPAAGNGKTKSTPMKKTRMILLLLLVASYGIVGAQQTAVILNDESGWQKIGETTVNFKKDTDEIKVVVSNRFAAIKFKVYDAPISLVSLSVEYESGDHQHINVNTVVKAPGESRTINLNGGERSIKKIVFVYKTLPNRKDVKAHVEILGLKTNTDKK